MVDAQASGRRGARGVAGTAGEEVAQLLIVKYGSVAVPGNRDLVGGLDIGGRGKIAAPT